MADHEAGVDAVVDPAGTAVAVAEAAAAVAAKRAAPELPPVVDFDPFHLQQKLPQTAREGSL